MAGKVGQDAVQLSRRRLIQLAGGGTAAIAAASSINLLSLTQATAAPAGQDIPDVPREETMVLVGVGGEAVNQFADPESVNPYLTNGSLSRSGYQVMFEPLAMYSMLTGEEYPWIAESWEYNEDFTQLTIRIRQGVTWSDGTP
jgi:peptide/nickel transport system substrate-binding protein